MAGWWMSPKQLGVLRTLDSGAVLVHCKTTDTYQFLKGKKCTLQGRALLNRGLIAGDGWLSGFTKNCESMHITPTGKNELGYNRGRDIEAV